LLYSSKEACKWEIKKSQQETLQSSREKSTETFAQQRTELPPVTELFFTPEG